MTHKSTQGSYRSPTKKNDEYYQQNQQEGETSQESHQNRKKYKVKKKNFRNRPPRFERLDNAATTSQYQNENVCHLPLVPVVPTTVIPVSAVAAYYPQQCPSQYLGYPIHMPDLSQVMTAVQVPNPVYSLPYHHMPVAVFNRTPVLATPMFPPPMISPPMMQPIIAHMSHPPPQPPVVIEELPSTSNYVYENVEQYSPEQIVPGTDGARYSQVPADANISTEALMYDTSATEESSQPEDELEWYLSLPRQIFPTAKMLELDPNPIIDELCKAINIHTNLQWMLDLEFGIPKEPITRPIPIYDVKFNSIRCKNAPNAIHPGFESFTEDFKRIYLFYYDSVISTWYKGFVATNSNSSVERFQDWLLLPMQRYGMCWP